MDKLTLRRWNQIVIYGWREAKTIAKETGNSRFRIFVDIVCSFFKWHVFSNQYHTYRFWEQPEVNKKELGVRLGEENKRRDNWVRAHNHNWSFLIKWTSLKYEKSPLLRRKRNEAYIKEFNAGEGLSVQFNVHIHREHYLDGTIKIGKNVLLSKNVFIDYSGFVDIGDNVSFSDGVVIESHSHMPESITKKGQGHLKQTTLKIDSGVWLGSKVIVLETCSKIGRKARIGSGSVLRKNVPPYAIIVGNPAKIVGFVMTPEEVELFEKDLPETERTPIEQYRQSYNKLFLKRGKEIREFMRL